MVLMGTFGWKSPFPLRFGGDGHKAVEDAYTAIRANLGDGMTDDESSATMAEIKAAARALAIADRAIDRYVSQGDPSKLTQTLERWESILAITPSVNDSPAARRRAVSARLTSNFSGTAIDLSRLAAEAFAPWDTQLRFNTLAEAIAFWPGGTPNVLLPWYSTVCLICVEYFRPAYASDADCESRRAACMSALEEHAPAWSILTITQTPTTGPLANLLGFYLDTPNLNVTVF
jgi:hypothetical protein